jgi:DNA-binding transcriptional LysR family regulator
MEYNNLPYLSHLATLRAVVELGGVAEAARSLHIGQPAVTKRLRTLDGCYGTRLMERSGRQLELTPAGKMVYRYARLALDHQAILTEDLSYLSKGQNNLRLETNFTIGEHLLPTLLLQFSENYPEYHIESRMGYSRRIQIHLATGTTDLALLEQAPEHPNILVQKWLDDEVVLVCGATHELSDTNSIDPKELRSLKFVVRESTSSLRVTLDQELPKIGIKSLPISMEVGSTKAIMEILQHGQHASFLPKFAVRETCNKGLLHLIEIQGLRIKNTLWIARTNATLNNKVADNFINLLHAWYLKSS